MSATIAGIKTEAEPADPKKKWGWLNFRIGEETRNYEKKEYHLEKNHELQLKKPSKDIEINWQ